MYDVCSRQSFSRLDAWFDELETYATNTNIVKMLIGNKIDKVTPFFVIPFRENMISHCDIYRNEEKWAGKKDSNLLKSIQCYSLKPAQKLKMESKWLLKNLSRRWFYIFFLKDPLLCQLIWIFCISQVIQTPGLWEVDAASQRGMSLSDRTEGGQSWSCSGYCSLIWREKHVYVFLIV